MLAIGVTAGHAASHTGCESSHLADGSTAGGYNRGVRIPRMNQVPDGQVAPHFRTIVTGEAAALGRVLILPAFLIGGAS